MLDTLVTTIANTFRASLRALGRSPWLVPLAVLVLVALW
jgi:hypothetical protein